MALQSHAPDGRERAGLVASLQPEAAECGEKRSPSNPARGSPVFKSGFFLVAGQGKGNHVFRGYEYGG